MGDSLIQELIRNDLESELLIKAYRIGLRLKIYLLVSAVFRDIAYGLPHHHSPYA